MSDMGHKFRENFYINSNEKNVKHAYVARTPERKMSSLQDGKISFERSMSPRNCSNADM